MQSVRYLYLCELYVGSLINSNYTLLLDITKCVLNLEFRLFLEVCHTANINDFWVIFNHWIKCERLTIHEYVGFFMRMSLNLHEEFGIVL